MDNIKKSSKRTRSCSPVLELETPHASPMSQEAPEIDTNVPSPFIVFELEASPSNASPMSQEAPEIDTNVPSPFIVYELETSPSYTSPMPQEAPEIETNMQSPFIVFELETSYASPMSQEAPEIETNMQSPFTVFEPETPPLHASLMSEEAPEIETNVPSQIKVFEPETPPLHASLMSEEAPEIETNVPSQIKVFEPETPPLHASLMSEEAPEIETNVPSQIKVFEPETPPLHASLMSEEAPEIETNVPSQIKFEEYSSSSAGGSVPTTPTTTPKKARRRKTTNKKTNMEPPITVFEPETPPHASLMSQEAPEIETNVPSQIKFEECSSSSAGGSVPTTPTTTPKKARRTKTTNKKTNIQPPIMFEECSSSSAGGSAPTTPTTTPKKARRPKTTKKKTSATHNLGSESESDSEEDEAVQVVVPRVFRAVMETPEDDESPPPPPPPPPISSAAQSHATPLEPREFLDFKWTSLPNPPIPSFLRRESFSNRNVGPTAPYTDPYDIFIDIWDRPFMEHIASQTNKYAQQLAQQKISSNELCPSSRINEWKDTTADEMYVFFAVSIAMGIVAKSRLVDYWNSTPNIFTTPGFRVYMSLRRYELLSRCLHFSDNKEMGTRNLTASEAKLFKIQPVLDHLNSRFQSIYNLQQNIALDESLLQWKGWLDINQFIPNKAAGVGIKTYEVCESQTGYLWRFAVHAYKRTENAASGSDPLQAYVPSLVSELLRGLENRGHTVWMDNFYNSPALARKLKTLGFDCVGTLRTNRQFVPQQLTDLTKANMRSGELVGFTSGDVDVMAWRDNNRVGMISTYHGDGFTLSKGVSKPTLIHDYNQMMGGVDRKDQMLAAFPLERKRTKIWYKKLFRRLLNVSILNAYIIGKHFSPITHHAFRTTLTESILSRHAPLAAAAPAVLAGTPVLAPNPRKENPYPASTHYLKEFELLPHQKERSRRKCVVCRKRVTTFCAGCNNAACMRNCFVAIHTRR